MTIYLLSITTYIHVTLNLGIYQQVWWGMYEIKLILDFRLSPCTEYSKFSLG